jgi:hypothetical protein
MKPSDVIALDAQKRGSDPHRILKGVHEAVKRGGIVLHNNQTSLVLVKIGQGIYSCHLYTHDSPLTLSKNLIQFIRQLENKGVHRLYGKADNNQIISLMSQIGRKIGYTLEESDLPRFNWMVQL